MSETRMGGKGEVNFGMFKGLKLVMGWRGRVRQWVVVVMSDHSWKFVREDRYVN